MYINYNERIKKLNQAIKKLQSVGLLKEADILKEELDQVKAERRKHITMNLVSLTAVIGIIMFTLVAVGCSSTEVVDEYSCVESEQSIDNDYRELCSDRTGWTVRDIPGSSSDNGWFYQEWSRD